MKVIKEGKFRLITDEEDKESTNYHIEYWYDRHERYWVVQVFDEYDREKDSENCPGLFWRNSCIEDFKNKYNTEDVRKV